MSYKHSPIIRRVMEPALSRDRIFPKRLNLVGGCPLTAAMWAIQSTIQIAPIASGLL